MARGNDPAGPYGLRRTRISCDTTHKKAKPSGQGWPMAAAQAQISRQCAADAQCDDGLFCNGVEVCLDGECVTGDPCPGQTCDELTDECVN